MDNEFLKRHKEIREISETVIEMDFSKIEARVLAGSFKGEIPTNLYLYYGIEE